MIRLLVRLFRRWARLLDSKYPRVKKPKKEVVIKKRTFQWSSAAKRSLVQRRIWAKYTPEQKAARVEKWRAARRKHPLTDAEKFERITDLSTKLNGAGGN